MPVATKEITLPAARARVARTFGVDSFPWTHDDVLWLSDQWGIFRRELELCERFEEEIMDLSEQAMPWWRLALRIYVDGFYWLARESPLWLRAVLGMLCLWVLMFMVGRS